MNSPTPQPQDSPSPDEIEVRKLYKQLLDGWNKRSAGAFAAPISEDGELIGFVGMVPPGQSDLDPNLNAIQTLVAAKRDGQWRIVLFQNTPAQLHGRPDLVQQMTDELRQLLK